MAPGDGVRRGSVARESARADLTRASGGPCAGPSLDPVPDVANLGPLTLYGLLTALVFAESGLLLGFFLPGDTVLVAAGLLSGDPRSGVSLTVLLALVVPAAVLGDLVGYATGRRAGPALLRRDGRVVNARTLGRARALTARYGAFSVVAARFVPWVRTFTPVLAGVGTMPLRAFLLADVAGALCWGAGLLVVGRLAAGPLARGGGAVVVAALLVAVGCVGAAVRLRRGLRARGSGRQDPFRSGR